MGINLRDGYADLRQHVGHKIVCVAYGVDYTVYGSDANGWAVHGPSGPLPAHHDYDYVEDAKDAAAALNAEGRGPANVAIECESCGEVLLDFDRAADYDVADDPRR